MQRKCVFDFLAEIGIIVFENEGDVDLRDYVIESLDFIQLIVAIEDYYNIEFPEEMLRYDILSSSISLENVVTSLIEKCNERGAEANEESQKTG